MRRTSSLFVSLLFAACASTSTPATPPGDALADSGPCAVAPEEISGMRLRAVGCLATVDGVQIPPSEFNVRARMMQVLFVDSSNPVGEMRERDLVEFRDAMFEEIVKGEVLTQELDRLGFSITEAEHRRLVTRWMIPGVDFETYQSIYREFERSWLAYEDMDRMHRGWSRARGYVCSVRPCEVSREEARARHLDSGVASPFEEVEAELVASMEKERWAEAHAEVMAPLMAKASVETFPENLVIEDSPDREVE